MSHFDNPSDIPQAKKEPSEVTPTFDNNDTKYRNLVESIRDWVWSIDLNGVHTFSNSSIETMLGYTVEEVVGNSAFPLIHADDTEKVYGILAESIEQKVGWKDLEIRWMHKDGSIRYIMSNSEPIFDGDNLIGFSGIDFDITKLKMAQAQLLQSQKMDALGVLAGGVAHEFNNLLTPILGYTESLIKTNSENTAALDQLEQIQIAGNRAKDLIQKILAYGRKSLTQKESIKLEPIVGEVVKLIENTTPANIVIECEIEQCLDPIYGMRNEIHQVLLNLCLNAIYAMPAGGLLSIILSKVEKENALNVFGRRGTGDFICLRVGDTGFGMDEITITQIFDPFFTTKPIGEGSGLGLSVVQGIVDQHKGFIDVESIISEGSIISICFPVSTVMRTPVLSRQEASAFAHGKAHILLVDDEPMILKLAEKMLGSFGHTVSAFSDCEEALTFFMQHPHDFDLVFTDYGMSVMNGKEFAGKIKNIKPEIPIVLITGYGNLISKEETQAWGIDNLLMKPFNLDELSQSLRKALDK